MGSRRSRGNSGDSAVPDPPSVDQVDCQTVHALMTLDKILDILSCSTHASRSRYLTYLQRHGEFLFASSSWSTLGTAVLYTKKYQTMPQSRPIEGSRAWSPKPRDRNRFQAPRLYPATVCTVLCLPSGFSTQPAQLPPQHRPDACQHCFSLL